jgi:hypothetical protein
VRRINLVLAACALASVIIAAFSLNALSSANRELASLKTQLDEISALSSEYLSLSRKMKAVEGRKNLTRVQGIVQAVDEIYNSLGLKERVKSVKPLSSKEPKEDRAEVTTEGISMNEMVNILYNTENSPMLLVIREIKLKTSFQNPTLLDMTMTLSLVKPE